MDWLFIVVIVSVVVFAALTVIGKLSTPRAKNSVFQQHDALFTAAERSFLGVLDQAVGEQYRIFGKVRVADVIRPAKGLDKGQAAALFNQIRAKHFDFVLCDPKTLDVKFVIELNDSSHHSQKRTARDSFLRGACNNAELPLLEVRAKRGYTLEEVRALLAPTEETARTPAEGVGAGRIEPTL
jgi:hypothetical protein